MHVEAESSKRARTRSVPTDRSISFWPSKAPCAIVSLRGSLLGAHCPPAHCTLSPSPDLDLAALASLLEACRNGDTRAAGKALESARPWIRARLERLGARAGSRALDLDDLTQETQVAAARALTRSEFASAREFQSWLATIAVNKLRDRLRSRGRDHLAEAASAATLDDVADAGATADEDALHLTNEWRLLCRCSEDVADPARRVMVMRRGLGVDWEVTAFVSERMVAAARSLYYRARSSLTGY